MEFHFNTHLHCWTLRRYADVSAAFRDPRFAISPYPTDEAAHSYALRSALQSLTTERVAAWKQELHSLPFEVQPGGDLVREVAEPWCHAAAQLLVGCHDTNDSGGLLNLARAAFAGGANPFDAAAKERGDRAGVELAQRLAFVNLGPAIAVQAFVAVSQTLTAFLAGAWLALLEHPAELELLRGATVQVQPMEELLRYAGPSRYQFRYLTTRLQDIPPGSRVALATGEANRDPGQFGDDAARLKLCRKHSASAGHLALGAGPHACVGASLVRAAAAIALLKFTALPGELLRLDSASWPSDLERLAIAAPQSIRIA